MEKKQLLLITENANLASTLEHEASLFYEITTVQNIHAGYPLALSYLPDVILMDHTTLGDACLQNLSTYKATHFLNKSFLFLLMDPKAQYDFKESSPHSEHVDGILSTRLSSTMIIDEIERTIKMKRCLTNYWKDSFMGLFNLLSYPVLLLEDEKVVAMNDAFKKDFFISSTQQIKLTDLVKDCHKAKVKEILRKFMKGKHMKSSTTTPLLIHGKLREANITFSKLDKALSGQLVMMINFTGKEIPINPEIGSTSPETEGYFNDEKESEEPVFTKREKEVISLLCKGYKTKEISEALCISTKTIEKHRSNIIKRTHSGTMLESIVFALNHNMIEI